MCYIVNAFEAPIVEVAPSVLARNLFPYFDPCEHRMYKFDIFTLNYALSCKKYC